jgi:hypothetical protein
MMIFGFAENHHPPTRKVLQNLVIARATPEAILKNIRVLFTIDR